MAEPRTLCLDLVAQWVPNWAFFALDAHFYPAQHSVITVVWREEGRAEPLHPISLCTWHTTSAQVSLHSWKKSAEVFYFLSSDAVIPHVREPTMQLQRVEHAPLLKIVFYTLFLDTVGYLFMRQEQGCPAGVYSECFICQVLAALVTISSIIPVV